MNKVDGLKAILERINKYHRHYNGELYIRYKNKYLVYPNEYLISDIKRLICSMKKK